ncbi:MAG: OmpA family protein [Desulfatitalea sp.]|nr:OmpA family protein [Desulfatitalea sp.]
MTARFAKRRRPAQDPPIDTGRWQMVYTGFILIMLCFFVLLTSFVSLEPSKITRFVSSFSSAVSLLSGGTSVEEGRMMTDVQVQLLAREDVLARLFEQVRQASQAAGLDPSMLQRTEKGVVLTLENKLLFDTGEATFSTAAYPRMAKIGALVKSIGVPVEIEGHTDDRPIQTPRFPSNWELSTARAVTVLRYLSETMGVDAQRLSAVGFAEYRPMVPNDSETHRAMNRRVDLVFKIDEGEGMKRP